MSLFTKKLKGLFVILSTLWTFTSIAQTTTQIGTGTLIPSSTLYSPIYRFSATSTTSAARSNIIYTQTELAAAGISAGSLITSIEFNKTNAANFVTPATFAVYMGNTSNTPPLLTSTTWASILLSHTNVYSSTSFNIPLAAGWVPINLSSPFLYTGGSLEIATELSMSGNGGATDAFKWEYTAGFADYIIGVASTNATLNGTVAGYKHRPNIKFVYAPASPCTLPVAAGTASSSSTSLCAGQNITLGLSGNSIGLGQTYQWQSAPSATGPWTNIGTSQTNSDFSTVALVGTTYYQCVVTCGTGSANSTSISVNGLAGLASNTYTINSGQPTGGLNFNNFADVTSALNCGVAGPVTFNVVAGSGPYTEKITLPEVNFTSSHPVKFNGNGNIIQYNTSSTYDAVLELNGSKYVTFDSFTFKTLGTTHGFGAILYNDCANDSITRCTFDLTSVTTTTAANSSGIRITNVPGSTSTTASGATNTYIGYNKIIGTTGTGGPYYGIYAYGPNTNNVYEHNLIADFYYYGLYNYYGNNQTIHKNIITRQTKTGGSNITYGLTAGYLTAGSQITSNTLDYLGGATPNTTYSYPLQANFSVGTASSPVLVANNIISNVNTVAFNGAIYINSGTNVDVYHNTINLDVPVTYSSTTVQAGIQNACATARIQNNIISYTGGGPNTKYGLYYGTSPAVSNNNNVYVNSTSTGAQHYGYRNAAAQTTLTDFQGTSTFEMNSKDENPLFANVAIGDLTPTNPSLNNMGAPTSVTEDFTGASRSATTPDPGAFEFNISGCSGTPLAGNTTVSQSILCPGATVDLSLINQTVAIGLSYQWQKATNITGPWIAEGAAQTSPLLYGITPSLGKTYFRCVVSCGAANATSTIDSVEVSSPLAGTYTINAANPTSGNNFASFTDFANTVNCAGVSAAVIVNVISGSGPYSEYVDFTDIPGTSATNTVTINGNGNEINFSTTTSERQIFRINGTKYLTIDSLLIKPTGTTFGWGAILHGGAAHNTIKNSTFDLSANSSTTAANSAGIVLSGSLTSPTAAGTGATNNTIFNNTLQGPVGAGGMYYGITLMGGADSNTIEKNKFLDFYFYGAYVGANATNTHIINNEFSRPTKTSVATFYGVYTTGVTDGLKIESNRIHTPGGTTTGASNTAYPLYILGTGTVANPRIIANNSIYKLNSGGTVYGMYLSSATFTKVMHNTIVFDQVQTGTSTQAGIWLLGTNTGLELYNNNISITAGNLGTKHGINYTTAVSLTSIENAQRNNVYINSTQAGTQSYFSNPTATTYASLAAFQAANPTLEIGSPSLNPQFVAPLTGDFTPGNPALLGTGRNVLAMVPTDINGAPRSSMPTPGSFEMPVPIGPNGATVGLISPDGLFCSGSQNVQLAIGNFGTTSLTGFQVHWQVNGVNQPNYTYTGTLAPLGGTGQNMDTISLGNANITAANTIIKAWTVVTGDINHANDTISVSVSPTSFSLTSASDTICHGADLTMSLNPTSGYTPGMIQWESSTNGTTFTAIPNSDQENWTVSNMTANASYRVRIINGSTTCLTNTKNYMVVTPTLTSTTPGSRCDTGSVQLSATSNLGSNVKWYDVATGGVSLGLGNSFNTPSLNATTTFYAEAAVGSGNIVGGMPVPLSTSGNSGFNDLGLIFDATSAFTISSVDVYPMSTTSTSGTVSIALKNAAGTTLQSTTANVTVSAAGSQNTIPLNFVVTPGTDYKLVVTAATGLTNLIRESGTAASIGYPLTIPNVLSITAGLTGGNANLTYYYYLYNWQISAGCASTRVPVVATVNPVPFVDLGNDTLICANTVFTLNAGNPGNTYLWNDNSTAQTKNVTTTGQYHVTVANSYNCSVSDTINVNVTAPPVVHLGNDTAICQGSSLVLDAGNNTGATVLWDNNTTAQTRTVLTAGQYYVEVAYNQNCKTTDTINVAVNALPVVNLGNDTSICGNGSIILDAGNAGSGFTWGDGSTGQTKIVTSVGQYYVTVTNTNNCSASDTIVVGYTPSATGNFTVSEGANGVMTFTATSNNSNAYAWDFGDGNTGTGNPVTHPYQSNGNFVVTLTIVNDCGETVDIIRQVSVRNSTVSINKVADILNTMTIYPNPNSIGKVTIETESNITIEKVKIVNVLGQVVGSIQKPTSNQGKHNIDLPNHLTSGIYNIIIETNAGIGNRKLEILK